MLVLKKYISNPLSINNLQSNVKSVLLDMNYSFPLDDAKREYLKVVGIDLPDFKPQSPYERRFMFDLNYVYGSSADVSWSNFIKLSNNIDYCIVKIIEDDQESEKKTKNKKYNIVLTIVALQYDENEVSNILNAFKKNINSLTEWRIENSKNEKFVELSQNYSSPNFSQEDYNLAQIFNDTRILNLLMTIKSSGSLLRRDFIIKNDKIEDIQEKLEFLKNQNLIKSEYVVLCKKTSEQINKAPMKESIDKMGELGISCSKCNRLITEESIEELITTTDKSNTMLDGSLWMTINLVNSLLSFGVPLEDILVNIEEGPEEIDAVVSIGESLLLFELKDSQFSLGHAYPFQSRLVVYNADTGIIWATKGVAPEVKEHFNKVKPDAEICYIESIEELSPQLGRIIDAIRWDLAETEMKPLLSSSMIISNIAGGIVNDLKKNSELEDRVERRKLMNV